MTTANPSIALLGTGTMGAGMARSLLRAGLRVSVWNRHPDKAATLGDAGATIARTVDDAVRDADVVITMLFDADAVRSVMQDAAGAMRDDAIWAQMSTVGLEGTAALAAFASENGLTMLDAPVVGTKKPAEDGTLTVLVSGDETARAAAQPAFDAMGAKTVWLGTTIGSASALKLVANSWIATITAGTAQAIELTRALGIDPAKILETMNGTAADSPYLQTKGAAIIDGSFAPQFALDGILKDLGLIQAAAGTSGVPTILIDALHAVYSAASDAGHGGEDLAAVAASFTAAG